MKRFNTYIIEKLKISTKKWNNPLDTKRIYSGNEGDFQDYYAERSLYDGYDNLAYDDVYFDEDNGYVVDSETGRIIPTVTCFGGKFTYESLYNEIIEYYKQKGKIE